MNNFLPLALQNQSAWFLKSFVLLFIMVLSQRSDAAVSVTTATGGTNICFDKAVGGANAGFTTIGNIVFTEGGNSDFGSTGSGTITITPPAGWQFNTSSLPTVTGGGTGITVTRVYTSGSLVITKTMALASILAANTITVSGLQVQATSAGAAAGNITNTAQTGTWTGLSTGTNLGSLSLRVIGSVTVTGGGSFCNTVTINASGGSGGTIYYQGTTSNGTSTSTASSSASISSGGTYYFRASNSGCWGAHGSAAVTINTPPGAVTVTGSGTFCNSTTINASGGAGGTIYYQGTTSGGTSTATPATSVPISSSGTYYFRARNAAGCWGTEGSVAVTINPDAGAVTVSGGGTFCDGAALTASGGAGGTIYFQGTTSGGTSIAVPSSLKAVLSSGTFYFRAQTALGCWGTEGSAAVTINPPAGAVTVTGGGTFCENTIINASGGAGGTIYFQGTTSGGTSTATPATSAPITSSGTYYFRARTAAGCWGAEGSVAVVINPVPGPVTGPSQVCVGSVIDLDNSVSGGTWVSGSPTIAGVNTSGDVNGINAGTSEITYTLTGGCYTTHIVTVDPLPVAISGVTVVCEESVTNLTNTDIGGTWSSAPLTTATVSTSGAVTGIAAGNATIVYTLPTGCSISTTVTVNTTPSPISGSLQVCEAGFSALSSSPSTGTWSSSATGTADVDGSGMLAGILAGNATIVYTLSNGCTRSAIATVDPLPAAITGSMNVCVNSTVTLADLSSGGTWGSGDATVIVGATSGAVTGAGDGTATITYTLPTGCRTTAVVTVDPLPAIITGLNEVCVNSTTTLFDFTTGGTWSSAAVGIATVNATTGEVTGIADGVTDIIYTLPTGCAVSVIFTAYPLPAGLTGNDHVCHGSTTTLSSTSAGGTWESSDPGIAGVDAGGNVSGVLPGTAIITYTLPTGCLTTRDVTVNALPVAITGPSEVCVNSTVTLSNTDAGGTWGSADGTVTVGATTGDITGTTAGIASITYTLPSTCYITREQTVNPLPAAIAGPSQVCEAGSVITLTNADAGGTWSSSDAVISVGATTGEITGITAGTAVVTYTLPTTCAITRDVTVNALPSVASGTTTICVGQLSVLSSTPADGTWTSTDVALVTVGAAGSVFGVSDGNPVITYTLPTGCVRYTAFTVNALPAAITGMAPVCEGDNIALANATTGGTWSSNDPGIAGINTSGTMTGVAFGSTIITYTSPLNCIATSIATVNALPAAITGSAAVCKGLVTDLGNATASGTWSSSNDAIATVDAAGIVTGEDAGDANISYILGTGCYEVREVTVNSLPTAITGNLEVCKGLNTTLGSTPLTGTWLSNATGIADIGLTDGVVSGIAAGTAEITYTLPTGCIVSDVVTVHALPVDITGTTEVCKGLGTTLSNADAGGSWSTGAAAIADIDAMGNVTGMADGTAIITYTLPTSCITITTYTVHPLPTAFMGGMQVCEGLSNILSNALTGGTWLSSDGAIADITPGGTMSGIMAGTADITYTLPTGCIRIETASVNAAVPAITGTGVMCEGLTTTFSNASTGGLWISGNTSVATADPVTGVVTGVSAGTVEVTYSFATGCLNTTVATVDPLPAPITGTLNVCAGLTTTLNNATPLGSWSGGTTGIASVDATGVVNSIAAGIAPFTYTLPTGCLQTTDVTVNALPDVQTVTGGGSYCAGGTGVHIGLGNTAAATTYKVYNGASLAGTFSGVGGVADLGSYTAAGTYTVNATATATGCVSAMSGSAVVTITPLITPSVSILSGHGDTMCAATSNTFTAIPVNGGTAPVYTWIVNAAVAGSGSVFVYTPAHGDVIKVILASSESCPSPANVSTTRIMTIIDNQAPTIDITKTSSDSVCQFLPVFFHAISTWGGDAPVYTWRRNTTDVATGTSYTYIPSDGDVITCRLTSNYRCRTVTNVTSTGVPLNVDSLYIPGVTISASPAVVVRPNTEVTLTANVVNAGPSPLYEWQINGTPVPGPNSPVLKRVFGDNDIVTCVVYGTGSCGLMSFNTVTMKIDENAPTDVVHVSVLNGDIRLMPNPTNGTFVITGSLQTPVDESVNITITNVTGQVVYNGTAMSHSGVLKESIHLDNGLANGVYLLRLGSSRDFKTLSFVLRR